MAASLTRPDPSSPSSIADAGFSTARRGYNQDEVRAFLTSVAAELSRAHDRARQLAGELDELRAAHAGPAALDEDTVAALLGEETVRVLQAARESASDIKVRAEENAARVVREATDDAKRLRHDAEVEAARRRQDAAADAEAEITLAKQQGREMVNEAREYRERVLTDLERRTTLARNQIEELLHGRDRLLQVFERARLVAVDVTAGLEAVDSPDELVNLAPTTGPVPVMVPNRSRPVATPPPRPRPEPVEVEPNVESDAGPVDAEPDVGPVDAGPVEVGPVEVGPVEVAPVEVGPVDAAPVEVGPVEVGPVEVAPVEVGPVEAAAGSEPVAEADPVGPDTNVVSLFPGRDDPSSRPDRADVPADGEAADPAAVEGDVAAGDPGDRLDVEGIFARLRDEVAPDEVAPDEVAPDEVAPDEVAPDGTDESTAFVRRDEALVPLIVGGARKLKRVLADEQNGVLDMLRGKRPVTALDELVPELDDHLAAYTDAIRDELLTAAGAGAAEFADPTRPGAGDRASTLAPAWHHLRTDLIGPLRERLARAVADGDGDNETIARTVRAVYREWKTQHIDDQLDDAFRFAHGAGLTAAAGATALVWTVDPSGPACPDCEDNSLAGPVPAGESYPTGHTAAPAHPGCRCLTLPAAR